MLESSLGIICKLLSDKRNAGRYIPAQIISTIHGLGNNSKGNKYYGCVSEQPLCVKSAFFNIPSPSVLGKITRTFSAAA